MIICAAVAVSFQRNGKTVEAVIPGWRHSSCWELMATLGVPNDRQEVEFLDRLEAFEHALVCGQLSDTTLVSKQERRERALYSEDIY